MDNEIINEKETKEDEKELLRRRREEQIERAKKQYVTDAAEKAEAQRRMQSEAELEKQLRPFYSVRKMCFGLCGFMWAFAVFCLLSGSIEMKIFIPMCLVALAALAAINIPIFIKKKKYFDGVIATGCLIFIMIFAVSIFMFG